MGEACPPTISISCRRRRFLSTRSDRGKALCPVPRAPRSPALQSPPGRAGLGTKSSSEVKDKLSRSPPVTRSSRRGYDLPFLRLGTWGISLQGLGPLGRPGVPLWTGLSCKEPGPSSRPLSWSGSVHAVSGFHEFLPLQHSSPGVGDLGGLGPFLAGSSSLTLLSICPSVGS